MAQPPNQKDNDNPDSMDDKPEISGTQPLNRARKSPPPATVLGPAPAPVELPKVGDTSRIRLVPLIPNPPPWRIIFAILHPVQATLGLDVRQSVVIGRVDANDPNPADVNLGPYHAADYGVSRQHAGLIPTQDLVFLVDLDSTNGTWLNGLYLDPGQRYELQPGDTVELGLMKLEVRSITMVTR